jgi:membrane fusion protein (multidrug efflux system)
MNNGPAPLRQLLLLATLACTACDSDNDVGARNGGFAPKPIMVVGGTAELRSISGHVEAIGTTLANESVTISAKVTDTVSHVRFEDGDLVAAGDVLLELTNQEETALLAEAQANVDDARTQFNRLQDLLGQGSVPVSQVDEARARFSAAQARYQSLVARLDDRLIRAPFAGLLGFRQVSAGTLITPGIPITTLDDITTIKLDFSIPEVNLSLITPGIGIHASSRAYPERTFEATLKLVGSRVDPVTRSVVVRATINNDQLLLRPGMLLTTHLSTAPRQALMVPEGALVQQAAEVFVYIIANGHAERRSVEHGMRQDGWVEIRQGLSPGEQVITDGLIKIRDGAAVQVLATVAT